MPKLLSIDVSTRDSPSWLDFQILHKRGLGEDEIAQVQEAQTPK